MVMRVLAPRRSQPAPVSGTFLSLTAHAALLASVMGGGGPAAERADAPADARAGAAPGGERLQWVGVGDGSGGPVPTRRPGTRPPIAYVVPGSGGSGARGAREPAPGPGGPPAPDRRADQRSVPTREPALRRAPAPVRVPLAALPQVVLPDAEATRLMAGVIASAPDLVRRASRPDDFAPTPPAELSADLLGRVGVGVLAARRSDLDLRALPIPFATNPPPAYPAALARSGVDGRVVVEFLIDSTGAVDLASLQVVQSTDARFTQAVRGVLPRLRFLPAQLGERSVGITVRQPFLFTTRAGR